MNLTLNINFFYYSGMVSGQIYVHKNPSLEVLSVITTHGDCITDLKFSHNRKYFASCDLKGLTLVYIWNTKKSIVAANESCECMVAWHPWKEDELIVGMYWHNLLNNLGFIQPIVFVL